MKLLLSGKYLVCARAVGRVLQIRNHYVRSERVREPAPLFVCNTFCCRFDSSLTNKDRPDYLSVFGLYVDRFLL